MGKRAADPIADPRPLILRIGLVALGTVLLVGGVVLALVLVGMFIAGLPGNLENNGPFERSPGGVTLGMAVCCVIVAALGLAALRNGRHGGRRSPQQDGMLRSRRTDGSGGESVAGASSRDSDGDSGNGGGGDGGGGSDGGGGGGSDGGGGGD
ncbi:MAG: hypothetical protein ABWX65_12190 [Mycetocola sp.]